MAKAYVRCDMTFDRETHEPKGYAYKVKAFGSHNLLAVFDTEEGARNYCRGLNTPFGHAIYRLSHVRE
jgi:hypothetical protein